MMAEHFSFFNSVNHDRKYKAEDWAQYFNSFLTNGVFPNPGTNLQVTATGSDMRIIISVGKAWINGYLYYIDTPLYLTLTNADGATNRIDRIVVQFDTANRKITAVVKQGAYATTPIALALERDADYYEIALADVAVNAGVTSITQSAITDQRMNTTLCGWVNSLIQADTSTLFMQYQTWLNEQIIAHQSDAAVWEAQMATDETAFQQSFTSWFNLIRGQLSTDAAGNLQNQINNISGGATPAGKAAGYTTGGSIDLALQGKATTAGLTFLSSIVSSQNAVASMQAYKNIGGAL